MEEREQPTLCVDCALKLKGRFGASAKLRQISLRYCQDGQHRLTPRCPTHGEFMKITDHGERIRCTTLVGDGRMCPEQRDAVRYQANGNPELMNLNA